ncbi:MAG: hypothetical protein NTY38_27090 [Acidobacteria bacterium]|nr:hypothetical protein [Acidobacteriota bacterium]
MLNSPSNGRENFRPFGGNMRKFFAVYCLILFFDCAAFAQTSMSSSSSMENGVMKSTMRFSGPAHWMGTPVTGAPYSAELVSEHTQTLADGGHIVNKGSSTLMYRDSEGRTRTERPMMGGRPNGSEIRLIEILDSVAGCKYVLDTVNKVGHRLKLPPPPEPPVRRAGGGGRIGLPSAAAIPPPHGVAPPTRPDFKNESLGTQMIEGLLCEGHRNTMTTPVGQMGNDRPLVTVSETWMSQELKVMVLSKRNDPRNGESVMKLININRTVPDPALFQIPPEYQTVDEDGDFSIEFSVPMPAR